MKTNKQKHSHTKFEIVLNTVYITSFIYIFGVLGYTIVTQMQSHKWRVGRVGVVDFHSINKTTTFIQCKYKLNG